MNLAGIQPPEQLLGAFTVAEAMHRGVITRSPSDTLRELALALAENEIHSVVIIDEGPPGADDDRLWGVVSDMDLIGGLTSAVALDAGNLSTLDVPAIAPEAPLEEAARMMTERGIAHLVVVAGDRPVGVISTLDIARAAARSPIQDRRTA